MKKAIFFCGLASVLAVASAFAQTDSFGDRAVELRGLSSDELAKPEIPDDAIADPPGTVEVPRPLYLVKRYYSCIPWLRVHVRSVHSTVPGWNPATTEIDTADDNPDGQLVTDINHAAYGLYCLRVVVCVPSLQWQPGIYHRFYVRLHNRHPYIAGGTTGGTIGGRPAMPSKYSLTAPRKCRPIARPRLAPGQSTSIRFTGPFAMISGTRVWWPISLRPTSTALPDLGQMPA